MKDRVAVWIPVKDIDEVMPMVRELRESKMVQGIDFDFEYQPGVYDWANYLASDLTVQKGVTFHMRDEKWATFLRMKFSDKLQEPPQ